MENNKLLEKLKNKERPVGVFFNTGSVASLEILGSLGYDFAIIDAEHGQYDYQQIELFIRAAESRGLTPVVRVPECSRAYILRVLDMGAMGLFLPFIKTADEVRNAVNLAKYPPIGERGYGHAHKVAYGQDPIVLAPGPEDYFNWANENTLVIPQCETADAVENIREILAVEGVCGVFIGPYDLSISLGVPCQFDHPKFVEAVENVRQACAEAGKFSFILGGTPGAARMRFQQGFDSIIGPSDIAFLTQAEKAYIDGVCAVKQELA